MKHSTSILLALPALALAASCVDVSPQPSNFHPGNHVQDWRDEIIYQVLTDRFADGDPSNDYRVDRNSLEHYHGGDWRGVADHLDYIQALGVTTLWISPIVRNVESDSGIDSYHGYWTQDPFKLNPHFGNLDDLRDLVGKVHARGMKIVLDIVTNHMGQLFYYDINMNGRPDEDVRGGTDANGNATSPTIHITEYDPDYEDPQVMAWTSLGISGPAPVIFINDPTINRIPPSDPVLRSPDAFHKRGRIIAYGGDCPPTCPSGREQTLYGDFPGGLKDVATERPDVQDAMVRAYSQWIQLADFDGFRVDTVKHVDHDFWQAFGKGIRATAQSLGKTTFLMFGEAFDGDDVLVGSYTHNLELDTLVDFPQYYTVFQSIFVGGGSTYQAVNLAKARNTDWSTNPAESGIGLTAVQTHVNFLDNHDVGRFRFQLQQRGRTDDAAALRNALVYLLLEDGIPCIYYGTEQEFQGGNDPANREDMAMQPNPFATDGATFQWIARLTKIRKSLSAFRQGNLAFVYASNVQTLPGQTPTSPDAGLLAFERTTGDPNDYALVVLNVGPTAKATASFKVTGTGSLVDVLPAQGGSTVQVGSDGTVNVTLDPDSAMVLVPQGTQI